MTPASSLHKNKITFAMSFGLGHFVKSVPGMVLRLAAVSMMLGKIEFTRTPLPLRSAANDSIIATAAALDAAYAAAPAAWSTAALEATLTMAPLFCLSMSGTAARHKTYPEIR